jgi:hypothetical protein
MDEFKLRLKMIEIIDIVPIDYLEQFFLEKQPQSHMAMAHLVLENQRYCNWIHMQKRKGTRIILDNSAPYLGRAIEDDKFIQAIELINPDEIVLPDDINNFRATKKRTLDFLKKFDSKGYCTVGVPQGNCLEEYIECYKEFSSDPRIDKIGLSYTVKNLFDNDGVFINEALTAREYLINLLFDRKIIKTDIEHHLLGFDDSAHKELEKLCKYSWITRADSNTSYKLAKHDVFVSTEFGYKKVKGGFSFQDEYDEELSVDLLKHARFLEYAGREKMSPISIADVNMHTMGTGLIKYLEIKMHQFIRNNDYEKILVVANFERSKNVSISNFEKKGKYFNWQRPSCIEIGDSLLVLCAPGEEYVEHYAALISSYLRLNNRKFEHVSYVVPTQKECLQFIENSNLYSIPCNDTVILGSGLEKIFGPEDWELTEGSFGYKQVTLSDQEITLVGCKFSFWGDISGKVVNKLAELGVNRIVYTGKLGGMKEFMKPNLQLVTGNSSYLKGRMIKWENMFSREDCAGFNSDIIEGVHYSSASILHEDKKWLGANCKFDFVDPEIGHMAEAALKNGIEYGYIHIISNNLTAEFDEDLSNERANSVVNKRNKLYSSLYQFLDKHL